MRARACASTCSGALLRRISPSPQIVAQHFILLGEHLELVVPGSAIQQQAMNQCEGMSCPGNFVIQFRAVHMSDPCLMRPLCHAISSFLWTMLCYYSMVKRT